MHSPRILFDINQLFADLHQNGIYLNVVLMVVNFNFLLVRLPRSHSRVRPQHQKKCEPEVERAGRGGHEYMERSRLEMEIK